MFMVCGGFVRGKVVFAAMVVVFTALYFMLTFIFAPISFLPFQVRVSDALIMLSAALGLPVVYGVFLGCILANLFPVGYPPNPLDVIFGSLANLIASYLVYRISYGRGEKTRLIISGVISSLIITFVVGSYLPFLFLPKVSWMDVFWLGYLGVLPGELVAQLSIGVPLTLALKRILRSGKPA